MQHARARDLLNAPSRQLREPRRHVSQLPILARRPGESRHVLDDQPSLAVPVVGRLVSRCCEGKSHGSSVQVAACPCWPATKLATPDMRTITENCDTQP